MTKVLCGCLIVGALLIVGVVGLIALGSLGRVRDQRTPTAAPVIPAAPRAIAVNPAPKKKLPEGYDPSKKAEREKFMQELFASGEISNGVGKVVVNKSFYQWTFEQKKIFAGVAYAWCLDVDPGCNLVVFKNQYTDKEVARFSAITGFEVK